MKSLTQIERLFLSLLTAAINGNSIDVADYADLAEKGWRDIIKLASRQAVLALVANQILSLPDDVLPPRELSIELLLYIKATEDANRRNLKALSELSRAYYKQDLPFVLLKGQSLGIYYSHPSLRSPGDIDLYLYREGDYERANEWAREQGYKLQGDSVYEQAYRMGKVVVENHLHIAYFGQRRFDRKLAEMLGPLIRQESWRRINIDGISVQTLPIELNAVYIFQHILHHFSYLGIGLRQICDWVLFLRAHEKQMDRELFLSYAEDLSLLHPMRIFATMASRYLGVESSIFPFPLSERQELADIVMDEVLRGGNFGFDIFRGKKFSSIWSRRWYMFVHTFRRSFRVSPISPEHISKIWLIAIITRLRLLFR